MRVKLLQFFSVLAFAVLSIATVTAQGTVTGKVIDKSAAEGLISADVSVEGTALGAITDAEGNFKIANVPAGEQTIVISYIGYAEYKQTVTVTTGQTIDLGTVELASANIGIAEVNIISSIAVDRKTPVAATTITGVEIANTVGNQEFPELLARTPSVYVTKQGGGVGDGRINIRGFDQSNTAVMINGIPVNDMENGWVYWSNWAGLTDVASTVQVQRGLGASKLAVPSVGGSINIITNPAERKRGGSAQIGYGNDNYLKAGVSYSTGLMDNGLALTVLASTTRGDGYVDGTSFEAYNYFASLSYTVNSAHTLVLTGLGSPQVHNQRTQSNFDNIKLNTFQNKGYKYNELWGELDGKEFSFRQNFYHKPKVFVNHYWTISPKTNLKTSAYVSFGRGGGTGPRGRMRTPGSIFDGSSKLRNADGTVKWDDIVAYNQGATTDNPNLDTKGTHPQFNNQYVVSSDGKFYFDDQGVLGAGRDSSTIDGSGFIRRASMNSHNWYGLLSTLTHDINENFTFTGGIDARYYKGEHYRRVENLLGADGYYSRSNSNDRKNVITTAAPVTFGGFANSSYKDADNPNVINYYNDGLVTWLGAFAQVEYSTEKLSLFGTLTGNSQSFSRVDYFNYSADDTPANDINDDQEYQQSNWETFLGFTVKGGVNYRVDEHQNIFANAGYLSRPPLFDVVFINFRNQVNDQATNQTTTAFELGYGYQEEGFKINLNAYHTLWTRQFDDNFQTDDGSGNIVEALAVFSNVNQLHQGIEAEFSYTPVRELTITGMGSVGNWRFTDNFNAIVTNTDNGEILNSDLTIYAKDLKVGDAAQTTTALSVDYRPIKGLSMYARYKTFDNLYARFDIASGSFENPDHDPIVKLPFYSLVDIGGSYNFDFSGTSATFGMNINNLLNTVYVSEIYTNLSDNPSTPANEFYNNEGFFGFGRTWNAFLRVRF